MADLADQYLAQLQALLPPGLIFSGNPDAEITQYLALLAAKFASVHVQAEQLRNEMDPRATTLMLDEWEESLGLPDGCTTGVAATADRRANILSKLTDAGGARSPRFIALAKSLGYSGVATKRFAAATCRSKCNAALWTTAARFTYQLQVDSGTNVSQANCRSKCNEALRSWGDAVLECVLTRETPAMAGVVFKYITYRVTESGEYRVTEAGDLRAVEI